MEWVIIDGNGTISQHNCDIVDGKCKTINGTLETARLIPVLVDKDRKPYTRDKNGEPEKGLIQTHSDGRRWGDSDICPTRSSPADMCNRTDSGSGLRKCDSNQKSESCPNQTAITPFSPFIDCGEPKTDVNTTFEFTAAMQVIFTIFAYFVFDSQSQLSQLN